MTEHAPFSGVQPRSAAADDPLHRPRVLLGDHHELEREGDRRTRVGEIRDGGRRAEGIEAVADRYCMGGD